jgi:hypothetical protein
MANSYDAEAAPPTAPDAAEAPAEGEGKASKADVAYRMGNPQRSCGLCGYFQSKQHKCDVVDEAGDPIPGDISPFGFCNTYLQQDNPFLPGVQATFDEGSETKTGNAAASEEPEQPRLQIGNRSYG